MDLSKYIQINGDTVSFAGVSLTFSISSFVEIIIFSIICYYLILWIKRTKAWSLLKGAGTLLAVYLLSIIFNLDNLSYLFEKLFASLVLAVIVIFQPELRRALEQLGTKNIFKEFLHTNKSHGDNLGGLSDESVKHIVNALEFLGKNKVGALIVVENEVNLDEYVSTGIILDAEISSALLEQIFEHNTPLHDGALIIRNNRILAATCYLPLSQNMNISKELGTRHRAGLGISEVSDCMTLIASEETGNLSYAVNGQLNSKVTVDEITQVLSQKREIQKKKFSLGEWWNGGVKNEK